MRNIRFTALFLLPSMFIFAQGSAPNKKLSYEDMVEKVKAGDKSIDFRGLRLAYMDSETREKYRGTDTYAQKQTMIQALRDHNYTEALKNAEEVLRENFVDLDRMFCLCVRRVTPATPPQP